MDYFPLLIVILISFQAMAQLKRLTGGEHLAFNNSV